MVLKAHSKARRAFRLAPIAASLLTLAFVAACARTNGKAPISTEKQLAIGDAAMKLVPDYNENAPENMALAGRIVGASIVVKGKDANKIDAEIKLVFTDPDHDDVIVRGYLPLNDATKAPQLMARVINDNVVDDDRFVVTAICGDSNCLSVVAEVIEQKDSSTIAKTTTVVAPAVAGVKTGQINVSGVLVAPSAPVAPATAAATSPTATSATTPAANAATTAGDGVPTPAAPAIPAPAAASTDVAPQAPAAQPQAPNLVPVAKDVIVFAAIMKPVVGEAAAAKVTRETTLAVIRSGLTPNQKPNQTLMSYEAAYQMKNKKPAMSEADLDKLSAGDKAAASVETAPVPDAAVTAPTNDGALMAPNAPAAKPAAASASVSASAASVPASAAAPANKPLILTLPKSSTIAAPLAAKIPSPTADNEDN